MVVSKEKIVALISIALVYINVLVLIRSFEYLFIEIILFYIFVYFTPYVLGLLIGSWIINKHRKNTKIINRASLLNLVAWVFPPFGALSVGVSFKLIRNRLITTKDIVTNTYICIILTLLNTILYNFLF